MKVLAFVLTGSIGLALAAATITAQPPGEQAGPPKTKWGRGSVISVPRKAGRDRHNVISDVPRADRGRHNVGSDVPKVDRGRRSRMDTDVPRAGRGRRNMGSVPHRRRR
jgi:hypothetical protein